MFIRTHEIHARAESKSKCIHFQRRRSPRVVELANGVKVIRQHAQVGDLDALCVN